LTSSYAYAIIATASFQLNSVWAFRDKSVSRVKALPFNSNVLPGPEGSSRSDPVKATECYAIAARSPSLSAKGYFTLSVITPFYSRISPCETSVKTHHYYLLDIASKMHRNMSFPDICCDASVRKRGMNIVSLDAYCDTLEIVRGERCRNDGLPPPQLERGAALQLLAASDAYIFRTLLLENESEHAHFL
jgi:hypothetical protein